MSFPNARFARAAYLVDAKVGVGVEVVVPRRHLLRADELADIAPAGTGGQGGVVGRVRDPAGREVGGGHRFGQRGGLGRLGEGALDGLLPLLEEEK